MASSSRPRKRKVEQSDKDIGFDFDHDINFDFDHDIDKDTDNDSHSDIDDARIGGRCNGAKMARESPDDDGDGSGGRADATDSMMASRKRKKSVSGIQGSGGGRSRSRSRSSSRRLSGEQVQFLEASFAAELRLEPQRKASIALQLGLKPRQVAVWFQNRRARWKSQQLELEHSALKLRYDALLLEQRGLSRDSARLEEHNRRLHLEVARLTALLLRRADEMSSSMAIARASPDLIDSDTESGPVNEEWPSCKLGSNTSSNNNSNSSSNIIGASLIDELGEMPAQKHLNSFGIGDAGYPHPHHHLLLPTDEVLLFEHQQQLHHAFMLQQLVHSSSGTIEDLFPHWEDQAHAFATIWGMRTGDGWNTDGMDQQQYAMTDMHVHV